MSSDLETQKFNLSLLVDLSKTLTDFQSVNLEMVGLLSRFQTLQNLGLTIFAISIFLMSLSINNGSLYGLKRKIFHVCISLALIVGLNKLLWLDISSLYVYLKTDASLSSLAINKQYISAYMTGILWLITGLLGSGFLFLTTKQKQS